MSDTEKDQCEQCGDEFTASLLVEHDDMLLCDACLKSTIAEERQAADDPDVYIDPVDDDLNADESGHLANQERCSGALG